MKAIMLATLLALTGPAMAFTAPKADKPVDSPAPPAMVMNALTLKPGYTSTNKTCVNAALDTFNKIGATSITVDENTAWAYMTINNNKYTVGAYCSLDDAHGVVTLAIAGPVFKDASDGLDRISDTWMGK